MVKGNLSYPPSVYCIGLWVKVVHVIMKHFCKLLTRQLVFVGIDVTVTLKAVKCVYKLLPVKKWDVRNALQKLGMSLDLN